MADDDTSLEKANRKGKGFSANQIIMGFLFIVGVLAGGAAAHYLIEPFLNSQLLQNYSACNATNQRLNAEISECLQQNNTISNPTGIYRVILSKYETVAGIELARKNYYSLTLYSSGSMQLKIYENNSIQTRDKPLSNQTFLGLAGKINENGFLNVPYRVDNGEPIYAITVENQNGSSEKTLECGTPIDSNCPMAFTEIQNELQTIWGESLPTD
ncbi:MAG: hypothetical protein V1777_02940 [Candidatus Micrarchaeota archaeon]